jgi:hypothetical protein
MSLRTWLSGHTNVMLVGWIIVTLACAYVVIGHESLMWLSIPYVLLTGLVFWALEG